MCQQFPEPDLSEKPVLRRDMPACEDPQIRSPDELCSLCFISAIQDAEALKFESSVLKALF